MAFGPIGRALSMPGGRTIRPPSTVCAWASGHGPISTCCTASRSERLAEEFGIPGQSDENLNALACFWHDLPAWPDVVGGLARLKRRYLIAPLSNGHVALLVSLSKSLGLPWDTVFGADLFRHYKPDPETYLGAAALFGCAPNEAMMVAAHPSRPRRGGALWSAHLPCVAPARIRRAPDRRARAGGGNFRPDGRRRRRTGGLALGLSGKGRVRMAWV